VKTHTRTKILCKKQIHCFFLNYLNLQKIAKKKETKNKAITELIMIIYALNPNEGLN